ncbi:MAG: hypothetical protein Kow0075_17470 [Salibacteraceae bacterium]
MDQNEFNSLIKLLDDPDQSIYEHVRSRILELGEPVIPELEAAWEQNVFGVEFQHRIEQLIRDIQIKSIIRSLETWTANGAQNLLEGALLVNRFQYPDFDEEATLKTLELIQQDVWIELNPNLTAFEQVKIINHILFDVHGFSGNRRNFHAPKNSFLSEVVSSRKGNPLSLGLIYSIIAQNLEIPIYGVNLPNHFVLAYLDRFSLFKTNSIEKAAALFYINPFSRGAVFSKAEIDHFLKQLKVDPKPEFYRPSGNKAIILRLLRNLEYSYSKVGDQDKIHEIGLLISVLEQHPA